MSQLVIRRGLAEPDTSTDFVPHKPARPEKSDGGRPFVLSSEYQPVGDQSGAIADLIESIAVDDKTQVLLGVTGIGKTFTMAKTMTKAIGIVLLEIAGRSSARTIADASARGPDKNAKIARWRGARILFGG